MIMAGDSETTAATAVATAIRPASSHGIILFYKYHPLSDDPSLIELYRGALERFCDTLSLKGRILVGCSQHRSEGINGTLSGIRSDLEVFVRAFTEPKAKDEDQDQDQDEPPNDNNYPASRALNAFRTDCLAFCDAAGCPPVEMTTSEFKWSDVDDADSELLFPDLNIKIVKELIGTGGVLSSIPIDELHKGYLTPQEWHERLSKRGSTKNGDDNGNVNDDDDSSDTILIDCRNTKECAIGNFEGAIDPRTTTFNQFPKWVEDHKHKLRNKSVLMYCTGGIRCEKASAYVRQAMGSSVKEVRHLQGGIHKYLEAFGNAAPAQSAPSDRSLSSLWRGKNFVFDGRGAHGPASEVAVAAVETNPAVTACTATVGACRYCRAPYDSFDPHCVCTVCKEPVLVCPKCQYRPEPSPEPQREQQQTQTQTQHENEQQEQPQRVRREYHCEAHRHLEDCYFTNLETFSPSELSRQLEQLQLLAKEIAVGKKFKQRRKTLMKQCAKLRAKLDAMGGDDHARGDADTGDVAAAANMEWKCRNCGQVGCSGKCWGYHGLKRKRILQQEEDAKQQQQQQQQHTGPEDSSLPKKIPPTKRSNNKNNHNEQLKERKELQKRKQIEEWITSGLTLGPSAGRDPNTGLRVPKPCVRVLETTTKGKWCGKSLLSVLRTEFPNSFRPQQQSSSPASHTDTETELDDTLRTLFEKELIRVNGTPIPSMDEANSYKLKNMDVIDRIVDWHEPPIYLPSETIDVQKIPISREWFVSDNNQTAAGSDDYNLYVCNKPSTVPVHPAGPYLSNSLTILVEAQEGLPPKTLIPCHRIDRVTSGMTICCANPRVARLVQTTIGDRTRVRKEYLAKVAGRFPANDKDISTASLPAPSEENGFARWKWINKEITPTEGNDSTNAGGKTFLQVDAPIETVDPLNGIRRITTNGKASTSQFRVLSYDEESDTTILSCIPVTGRSHQLRVHLEWLGHSIVDDVQYGGDILVAHGSIAIDPMAGIQRLRDSVDADSSRSDAAAHLSSSGVTETQALAAREVCSIRNPEEGPAGIFNPSQLLQGGHTICLHAYRYALVLGGTSSTVPNGDCEGVAASRCTIDMKVDLPPWASNLESEEL